MAEKPNYRRVGVVTELANYKLAEAKHDATELANYDATGLRALLDAAVLLRNEQNRRIAALRTALARAEKLESGR